MTDGGREELECDICGGVLLFLDQESGGEVLRNVKQLTCSQSRSGNE